MVQSIMGNVTADWAMMVVKAPEGKPVLQDGTCVKLGGDDCPQYIGRIVEVFGQVSAPLYVVRYDQSALPECLDTGAPPFRTRQTPTRPHCALTKLKLSHYVDVAGAGFHSRSLGRALTQALWCCTTAATRS